MSASEGVGRGGGQVGGRGTDAAAEDGDAESLERHDPNANLHFGSRWRQAVTAAAEAGESGLRRAMNNASGSATIERYVQSSAVRVTPSEIRISQEPWQVSQNGFGSP